MVASPPLPDPKDPKYIARQRVLLGWVDRLFVRGILTGEILQMAREGDHVVSIDFEGERFTLALYKRHEFLQLYPKDSQDPDLVAMRQGQPPLAKGETVATWLVATEWAGDKALVAVHGPLRAWRDAKGTA